MPFLLLLIISVAAGLGAAWLTRLYTRSTHTAPVVEAAREAGRHATGPTARRAVRAARLDPEKATGLALTVAVAAVLLGAAVLALLTVLVRSTDALAGLDTSA